MTPLYDFRSITTVDIPACFKIAALSMQDDKQNQFKAACRDDPYDHEEGMRGALQHWTKPGSRSQTVLATDRNSGAVVGWMVWNYHEPKPEIPVAELEPVSEQEGQKTQQARSSKARLEAYSSSEMQKWMKVLTPVSSRRMYICSIAVLPRFQGKGAGSLLVEQMTDLADADEQGVFCWVQASEGSEAFYNKHAFETVGRTTVELDAWNNGDLNDLPNGGSWGMYSWPYMRREATSHLK